MRAILLGAALVVLCLGTWVSLRALQAHGPAPPTRPEAPLERDPEPDRAATRQPELARESPKLVPAAAGVELRWAELNREGIAAMDAGDLEGAIATFERCRAAVPGEPVFRTNLAEALARLSMAEEAKESEEARERSIAQLARAAELAPDREDLKKRLAHVQRLADSERGFLTEPSEHFQLSYDGARTDILWSSAEITKRLEAAYLDFGELFGFWPVEGGRPRIRVVLYKKQDFHAATGIGHWAGGLYDGAVRVPIEDLGREQATLERVLRHEVAHAFIHAAGGSGVPGWLNEGLAQWLEPPFVVDRGRAVDAARQRLRGQKLFSLAELQGSLGENRPEGDVSLAYTQALALCGWITASFGERLLFEMVSASKGGTGWREVFRRSTGIEVDSALTELAR